MIDAKIEIFIQHLCANHANLKDIVKSATQKRIRTCVIMEIIVYYKLLC